VTPPVASKERTHTVTLGDDEQPDDYAPPARTDADALRALAVGIIENAIYYATSPAAGVTDAERADALKFLLDESDRRLESWVSVLDLDAEALRDRLRHRLRRREGRAA